MTSKTVSNSTLAVQNPAEQQHTANSWFTFHGDWPIAIILGILGILTFVPLIMLLELSFKSQQQMADAMWLPSWPLYFQNYLKA